MRLVENCVGKLVVWAGICVFGLAIAPSVSQGAWVVKVGNTIKLTNGPGSHAGEFIVGTAQPSSGSTSNTSPSNYSTERFRTFCVQVNEFVHFGEELTIRGISHFSETDKQPLSARTSALYRAFMSNSGNIFGATYDFLGVNRAADADLLQKAIWKYQGQGSYAGSETTSNNKFVAAVESLNFADGLLAAQLTGTNLENYGGVQILNLTRVVNGYTMYPAQDQLYWSGVPIGLQGPSPVPEPTMMALFLFGTIGAGWTARRKNRKVLA